MNDTELNALYLSNLTHTQARCTELFMKVRRLSSEREAAFGVPEALEDRGGATTAPKPTAPPGVPEVPGIIRCLRILRAITNDNGLLKPNAHVLLLEQLSDLF